MNAQKTCSSGKVANCKSYLASSYPNSVTTALKPHVCTACLTSHLLLTIKDQHSYCIALPSALGCSAGAFSGNDVFTCSSCAKGNQIPLALTAAQTKNSCFALLYDAPLRRLHGHERGVVIGVHVRGVRSPVLAGRGGE